MNSADTFFLQSVMLGASRISDMRLAPSITDCKKKVSAEFIVYHNRLSVLSRIPDISFTVSQPLNSQLLQFYVFQTPDYEVKFLL